MPSVSSNSMWSSRLALALMLAAASGALAQQPELPTPGQAPGNAAGQAQQAPPGGEVALGEEPVQEIAAQPAPQVLFGQPGYGIGGYGVLPQYLDLDLGLAYTDNALLTHSDRMSSGIVTAGFDTDYNYVGSNLDILARGNIEWLDYFDHAFPSTAFGFFDGLAMWGHSSDLLQWVLQETYTEGQTDPLLPGTPLYLEEVNYFTTGPYLNLNFTTADRLTFYGLYSNTAFQSSPFSSQEFDGGSTFTHGLSASSSLGLQLDSAYYSFDNTGVASDYNLRSARVQYNAEMARTRVAAGAGYAFEDFGGSYSGSPLLSLDLTRQVSASSSLALHGFYGYTTFGSALRANLAAPISAQMLIGAVPGLATAAPFKDHLITVGWNFARARTAFSLLGAYDRQIYAGETAVPLTPTTELARIFPREVIYEGSLDDNHNESVVAALTRSLRPTLSLRLQASHTWSAYGQLDSAKVALTIVNLSLHQQFRKLGVSLYVQRAQQGYSGEAAPLGFATGSYSEDRGGIEFTYDVLGQRTPGAPLPETF
jgi:hypothetical protein